MAEKYWQTGSGGGGGRMALRASLAWDLLKTYGLVAGKDDGEDSAGRGRLVVVPAAEAVARAFALADGFVETAEARGELRPVTDADEEAACARAGELRRVGNDAEYPRTNRAVKAAMEHLAGDIEQPGA